MGKLDKTQWVDTMIFLNKDSHMQHRQFDKRILAKYPKTASANSHTVYKICTHKYFDGMRKFCKFFEII